MMDNLSQLALTLTQEEIKQDLQPIFIAQDLVDFGVIDGKQQSKILSEASEDLQTSTLINEILSNGGPGTFDLFMETLKKDGKYDWLADALKTNRELLEKSFNEFNDSLTKGGVPHLPPHMLTRIDLQKFVRTSLENVFRKGESGYVTIHGMGGSGKSTLAAAAVRDFQFTHDLFPQGIYWLKIGKNVNDDSLLIKMHTLCEKLDPSYRESMPLNVEMAIDRLRVLFTNQLHRKSLLILDDVWDDSTIRHFDFGCRILLTTRNKNIMDVTCRNVLFVDIRDGFSLPECLEFLADSLKRNVNDLPRDLIKKIHKLTDGSPMVMSIISSCVRSVSQDNREGAFQNCLRKLEDNSFIKNKKKTPYEYSCIEQALELSVASLDEDLLEYYYDLAIFSNEFYIIGKVLATFWKKYLFDVVEIMTTFIEKSVATQVSNGHSNLYTIHDLYLYYLKAKLDKDSLMSRHKRLLANYLEKCNHKYENLPDDGYILQFIGHHLNGARMYDAFPLVFLDLKVLIPKIKATGPADLLGDFERYENKITQNGKHAKKLKDFKEFVRSNAHLLSNTQYDICQVALCQPSSSEVFQQAKKICESDPNACYYEWCNSDKLKSSLILSTQVHKKKVACAKFSHDGKHIISAGNDMIIKILKSHSGREVLHLKGHRGEITWLANCLEPTSRKEVILSSAADTKVMIWRISPDLLKATKKVRILHTPYTSFEGHTTKVVSCCILNDGVTAASMGHNGEVKVWKIIWSSNLCSEVASWEAHCGSFEVGQCDLMPDGSKLVSTARTFLKMWDVKKVLPEWEVEERDSQFVSCCFATHGGKAFVLAAVDFRVNVYAADSGGLLFSLLEPNRVPLLNCAISGKFIAASTNAQSVVVWDMESREVLDCHHGHKGSVCSVSFYPCIQLENNNKPASDVDLEIVSAGNDGTVMVWRSSSSNELVEVILREIFSCRFDSENSPIIAGIDVNNKIKVYDGQQNLVAGENGSLVASFRVMCCTLSHKRDKVLYGCSNGSLKLFDIRSNTAKTLYNSLYESKSNKVSEATCCDLSKDDNVIVAGHGDGELYIWRNNIIWTQGHAAHVTCLKFFNNDVNLASGSYDNTLKVWNVGNGKLMFTCAGHTDSVVSCDILPDSKLIVSASTDKTLMIWDASTGNNLGKCLGHEGCVRTCAFSPCGKLLASGDDFGIVKLWPIDKENLLDCSVSVNGHVNDSNAPNSTKIIEPLNSISFGKCNIWIHDLAFSADGSKFVICSDVIQCWSLYGTNKKQLDPHLLQTFPIRGSKASHIFCSENFESFVTIDDTGVLYHLKLIMPSNKEMLIDDNKSKK